ncbi:MAG: P1 family peptidase, partial [Spirochaetaceae bacterium]|nr:P1 family peptidase [Spirochaetaceae bacterium]
KGGIGGAALCCGDLKVGAIAAVNCVGDVLENGKIIAGTLHSGSDASFADSEKIILSRYAAETDFFSGKPSDASSGNTILVCIITNARLDKVGATRLAAHGQNGIARCVRPSHSLYDGDTVFAMCNGTVAASFDAAAILAARAVEAAIIDAVKNRTKPLYPPVFAVCKN